MMENKETIEYKGYTIEIIQDDNAESPNECENEDLFLVYEHRQFNIVRDGFEPREIFEYLENCHEQIEDSRYDNYFIFPVDAYIHSGVNLSLANTKNYLDRKWDVSTTGYILVKKDILREDEAREYAEDLIEEWNQYLSGDVYGYRISKKKDLVDEISTILTKSLNEKGFSLKKETITECLDLQLIKDLEEFEEVDSCWGFYGKDICLEEAKSVIDNYDRI